MLLDTDILIDLSRQHPAALAWLSGLSAYPSVAGIAAFELVFGSQSAAELRQVRAFLAPLSLVWPSPADMLTALSYAPLKLSHGLGMMDTLIAATAIGSGLSVATFNVRHFSAVPGLITVQPYVR